MSAEENRDSGPATRVCHVCQERKYVAGNVNGFYFCLDCACRVGELAKVLLIYRDLPAVRRLRVI